MVVRRLDKALVVGSTPTLTTNLSDTCKNVSFCEHYVKALQADQWVGSNVSPFTQKGTFYGLACSKAATFVCNESGRVRFPSGPPIYK